MGGFLSLDTKKQPIQYGCFFDATEPKNHLVIHISIFLDNYYNIVVEMQSKKLYNIHQKLSFFIIHCTIFVLQGDFMESNIKKRNIVLTIVLLTVIAVATLVTVLFILSVQNREKSSRDYLTANTVITQVIKKMNYQNLSRISDENISKYYNIPQDTVTDSAVYVSNRADSGMELACFRLKSEEAGTVLSDAISEYLSSKNTENKEGSGQLSKAKTDTVYPYVFVAVASDSEAAVGAFEEILHK